MGKQLLLLLLLLTFQITFAQNVVINEVVSSNKETILDEDGDATDWIELYNVGNEQVSLSGFYISDDPEDTKKWQIENAVIEPQKFLLIYASDKNRQTPNLHTNFKISADGENIILSDVNGNIVDQVDVPQLTADISYGRISDGAANWVLQTASPGSENLGELKQEFADSVSVSLPGGFYQNSVTVTLSAGDSKIYYTLDGKDPDNTSIEYNSPITISKTSVLKAISYKENFSPSPVVYSTYLINEDTKLPVISLISDPYNLFDYNYGIYEDGPGWTQPDPHKGANYWMDWERLGHVEFFDDDKNLGFSKDCILAIYGAWSRAHAQKSFSIKFKDGIDPLEYPLFPNFDVTTFKSFILRNAGNDFYNTHIRDAMMQTLIEDLDIDYLEYRPATTFINGEYWGIYNIREKISEHYVANRHGVDPDNIDMLEGNMEVLHGDTEHYQQLIDYISNNDMTTDEAYEYVNDRVDLRECLLYFAAQLYYNNQDWPSNNIKYWRERSETGKWRWIIYDLDFGFNLYENNGQAEDHVNYVFSGDETRPGSNPPWSTLLPRKLVENPTIKNQFINLVADLLNSNFKSDRVINTINEMVDHISSEIAKHRERFNINGENLNKMISFAEERPGYLRGFMRNFFRCGSDGTLKISASGGGKVQLNSLELQQSDFPWSGVYFQNNTVHLKAIPEPGYKFDGWSGPVSTTDQFLSLNITQTTNLTANFSIDSSSLKGIVINEINYNSADTFDPGDWIELHNTGDESIDMSNWYFSDSDDEHKFIFPVGTIIDPNQYLVLFEEEDKFKSLFPDVNNFIGSMDFGLGGGGELIRLFDHEGQIVDSLTYDDKLPWPEEADGSGATLELADPLSDNSLGENWRASIGNGTPGKINSVISSVKEYVNERIPENFVLYQNYPNPFNPTTTIRFSIPKNEFVTLKIYNTLGQEIAQLISKEMNAGTYSINWNAGNYAGGIYYYNIIAGDFKETKKLVLLK